MGISLPNKFCYIYAVSDDLFCTGVRVEAMGCEPGQQHRFVLLGVERHGPLFELVVRAVGRSEERERAWRST